MGGPNTFSAHEPPPENRPDESRRVRRRATLPGERYDISPEPPLFFLMGGAYIGGLREAEDHVLNIQYYSE